MPKQQQKTLEWQLKLTLLKFMHQIIMKVNNATVQVTPYIAFNWHEIFTIEK
jgi:hypothetical protein